MSDIFISYARGSQDQAHLIAETLRGLGYGVWRDDELPAHRDYSEVIEERLRAAKAVVVVWCAEAVKSQWVRAEADIAREAGTLVQLTLDATALPLPFNRIQCADLSGWSGDVQAPGWKKVAASVVELIGGSTAASAPTRILAAPTLPSKPSIAVMPFANLSGDPEQEYFADGMVEEITAALSRFGLLFVISSGSTLSFKGKAVNPKEAARQLGVRYVLEGSVRRAADRVRITVKLTDATDGAQIWTGKFDDSLEDMFALQDKVALSVAGTIEPTVQRAEGRRLSRRPTANMGSYDLYLRGASLYLSFEKSKVLEARDLFDRSVAMDPDFGLALAHASQCRSVIAAFGWSDDVESVERQAVTLAHRAVQAAPDDARALATAAIVIATTERDLEAALALAERAVSLNPGSALALNTRAVVRLQRGDSNAAIEDLETALRLDPTGPYRPNRIGWMGQVRFQQKRFDDAVSLFKELLQAIPHPRGFAFIAACYAHLGHMDAARAALASYRAVSPQPLDAFARSFMDDPANIKLFLDGIALAEGKRLAADPG